MPHPSLAGLPRGNVSLGSGRSSTFSSAHSCGVRLVRAGSPGAHGHVLASDGFPAGAAAECGEGCQVCMSSRAAGSTCAELRCREGHLFCCPGHGACGGSAAAAVPGGHALVFLQDSRCWGDGIMFPSTWPAGPRTGPSRRACGSWLRHVSAVQSPEGAVRLRQGVCRRFLLEASAIREVLCEARVQTGSCRIAPRGISVEV